ncbi:MAG TPA: Flp pilus assembly protein CpaB [Bryobacteraceae bacterium]|nr:Flp pilus assembly protein CpaB [Bryobacteraceae bacterium]
MKRNMVPLLGIAFVVAIISTGVFYGLFAGRMRSASSEMPGQSIVVAARNLDRGTVVQANDLRVSQLKGSLHGSFSKVEDAVGVTLLEAVEQNEPVLQDRVASRDAKSGTAGGAIPAGMRAISLRVSESSGIVSLLRKGTRVDVQAVLERGGTAELRTILQNVEVLSVGTQVEPVGGGRPPAPVVTVLARAQDADAVALADSSARVRVALRNPLDESAPTHHSLALSAVFNGATVAPAPQSPQQAVKTESGKAASSPATFEHPVQLHVQVLGASAEALGVLDSKLAAITQNGALHVAAFRADADAAELVRSLEQKQELEIVSAWTLTAGVGRPISFHAGTAPDQFRVVFSPEADSGGRVSLRVKPEISLQRDEGIETRKYDADLPDGVSFLVKGLLRAQSDRGVLDRIYPGHSWGSRELVILVTPRGRKPLSAAALVQANRGR